jgi:4-hydroxy-2-oxoheptanedioate aldolase
MPFGPTVPQPRKEDEMPVIKNPALERLRHGEIALGIGVRLARSIEIAKMMRASDYDWLFIDLEHGSLSLETVSQISIAAADNGIAPIVRVPTGQWDIASRALDGGALGIIMPHINTVEEARRTVDYLCFPPLGHRATLGGLPQYDYLPVSAAQAAREVNAETLIAVMIESPEGAENAERIAAVDGIDVLLIGVNDLAEEMGFSGRLDHPDVVAAVAAVAKGAATRGKHSGIGGVGDDALLRRFVGMGVHFVMAGNDFSFLMAGARSRAQQIRGKSGMGS